MVFLVCDGGRHCFVNQYYPDLRSRSFQSRIATTRNISEGKERALPIEQVVEHIADHPNSLPLLRIRRLITLYERT